jgi:hypothetical protein
MTTLRNAALTLGKVYKTRHKHQTKVLHGDKEHARRVDGQEGMAAYQVEGGRCKGSEADASPYACVAAFEQSSRCYRDGGTRCSERVNTAASDPVLAASECWRSPVVAISVFVA